MQWHILLNFRQKRPLLLFEGTGYGGNKLDYLCMCISGGISLPSGHAIADGLAPQPWPHDCQPALLSNFMARAGNVQCPDRQATLYGLRCTYPCPTAGSSTRYLTFADKMFHVKHWAARSCCPSGDSIKQAGNGAFIRDALNSFTQKWRDWQVTDFLGRLHRIIAKDRVRNDQFPEL